MCSDNMYVFLPSFHLATCDFGDDTSDGDVRATYAAFKMTSIPGTSRHLQALRRWRKRRARPPDRSTCSPDTSSTDQQLESEICMKRENQTKHFAA